jgi:hypothetical protein
MKALSRSRAASSDSSGELCSPVTRHLATTRDSVSLVSVRSPHGNPAALLVSAVLAGLGATETASPFLNPPGCRLGCCASSPVERVIRHGSPRSPLPAVAALGTDRSGRASALRAGPAGHPVCRQRVSEPVPALRWVLGTRARLLRWPFATTGRCRSHSVRATSPASLRSTGRRAVLVLWPLCRRSRSRPDGR